MITTLAKAKEYLDHHLAVWGSLPHAKFNPLNRDPAELPQLFGFMAGPNPAGGVIGAVINAEGETLFYTEATDEGYLPHDLALLEHARPDVQDLYVKRYPAGFKCFFLTQEQLQNKADPLIKEFDQAMERANKVAAAKLQEKLKDLPFGVRQLLDVLQGKSPAARPEDAPTKH